MHLTTVLFDRIGFVWTRRRGRPEQRATETETQSTHPMFRVSPQTTFKQTLPYQCKSYLLTLAERHFFDVLSKLVHDDIYICPQVSFGAVLKVTAAGWDYFRYWDKVKAKRIDFLLCDKRTLAPLVAIELDDSSHDVPKRAERDDFVDHACHSAGLALLRFRVRNRYDREDLTRVLYPTIDEARIAKGIPAPPIQILSDFSDT